MANSITVDAVDIERLSKDLKLFGGARTVGYAARSAINTMAFENRKIFRAEMDNKLTLRNKFTQGSIRTQRAVGTDVNTMHSVSGSVQGYMALQETGGIVNPNSGSASVPVPTATARQGSLKRMVAQRMRRKNINLATINLRGKIRTGRYKSKSQEIAANVRQAAREYAEFVFLETSRARAIYQLSGSSRRPKMRMVWNLNKKTTRIRRQDILSGSLKKLERKTDEIMLDATLFQMRRNRLFR